MKLKIPLTVWITVLTATSVTAARAAEDLSKYVLYGGASLSVNDRATVIDQAPGLSSNIYGKKVEIGVDAVTGNVAAGITGVTLRDRATVNGDLFYSGPITKQSRTIVSGEEVYLPRMTVPGLSFIDKTFTNFPPTCPGGSISIEPSNDPTIVKTRELAPGSYCSVSVKSRTKLILTACDDYYIKNSLSLEPGSILEVRGGECGKATRIYIGGSIIYRGRTFVKPGETIAPEKMLFVSFTTGTNFIERPFIGTIIAPNGYINISMSVEQGTYPIFWGAALAGKNLYVHQGSIILPATAAPSILAAKGLSPDGSSPGYWWANGTHAAFVDNFESGDPMNLGMMRYAFDILYANVPNNSMYRVTTIDDYSTEGWYWTFGKTCAPFISGLESSDFQILESGDECVVLDLVGPPKENILMTGVVTRDPLDDGRSIKVRSSLDDFHDHDDLCSSSNADQMPIAGWTMASYHTTFAISHVLPYQPNTFNNHMKIAFWNTDDWQTYPALSNINDGIVSTMVDYAPGLTCTSTPEFNARAFWTDSESPLFENMVPPSIRQIENWCDPSDYEYCAAMYANLSGGDAVSELIGNINLAGVEITDFDAGEPILALNYKYQKNGSEPVEDTQIIRFYEDDNGEYQTPCPSTFACVPFNFCSTAAPSGFTPHPEYSCLGSLVDICCEY